jgi:hypothetical protein
MTVPVRLHKDHRRHSLFLNTDDDLWGREEENRQHQKAALFEDKTQQTPSSEGISVLSHNGKGA